MAKSKDKRVKNKSEPLIDDRYWEEEFNEEFEKIHAMSDEEFEEYLKKTEKEHIE